MTPIDRATGGHRSSRRRWYARVVAVVLALVLAWHMLATFIWSSGSSPIRNVVGTQTLNSYMLPMFGQSWSVFAPNPIQSNTSFDVRARMEKASDPTDWFNISGRDVDQAIEHHLLPSRLYLTNFQLISHYRSAFDSLNKNGHSAVGKNYTGSAWNRSLRKHLSAAGSDAEIAKYMSNARAVNAVASAIARAQWGSDIASVQIRTVKTPVTPYDNRLDKDFENSSTYIMTGWRPNSNVDNIDQKTVDGMYGDKAKQK